MTSPETAAFSSADLRPRGRRLAIAVAPAQAPEAQGAARALTTLVALGALDASGGPGAEAEVVPAEGPDDLLAWLERDEPDVLVLAGEEALALCERVRARWSVTALPILVIGARLPDAFAAGANDGVPAGWTAEELGARTAAMVRSRRLHTEALAEARRANAQLFEQAELERRRAEEANHLKDEFLANLSHELRTPLTAILGWARILRTRELPEDRRARALEAMERNAVAQARLVEDLLDVSRIIAQKLTLDIGPVDPALCIETAIEALRPAAELRGVAVRSVLDGAVGTVPGDFDRLRQVVVNLLSNAVKFTPSGGSIEVRLTPADGPGEGAQIAVADTGEGIRGDFLPFVFDRFRQADGGLTRAHGGLGLGLAIVRHLVELHGGRVSAHSAGEGRGATFTVHLPGHDGGDPHTPGPAGRHRALPDPLRA